MNEEKEKKIKEETEAVLKQKENELEEMKRRLE